MFDFLFSSKNEKLVKKWQNEHKKIVELALLIVGEYAKNNHDVAKKALKELNEIAINHVMNEDIEFFKLSHDDKKIDKKIEMLINDFTSGFKTTKLTLMDFLRKYSKPDVPLDDVFFKNFNELIDVLGRRIDFEEKNLYLKLKERS